MSFNLPKFVKQFDSFGAPMPSFNMGGETKVMTSIGACISLIFKILILIFGMIKLEHLLNRKNPTLNTNKEALE